MIDIQDGIEKVLDGKKKLFAQHVNRISSLDDPCLRRLYYSRHDWDKATPTETGLQGIFETGNILEDVIMRIVLEVGAASKVPWRIVGTQTSTNDNLLKEYQISGTIDGFFQIKPNGEWITDSVVDIKTMSQNVFNSISDYQSLSKYAWTKRYRGQVMLYALAHNMENCSLLLVNKSNLYDMKLIEFPVDMAYCDELLKKAETVNRAVEDETPPDGIDCPDECPKCRFFSFCCPSLSSKGNTEVVVNDELQAILERLEELKPTAKEYSDLEKMRDGYLVKGQDMSIGNFLITWKEIPVVRKAQPASEYVQFRKTIRRL